MKKYLLIAATVFGLQAFAQQDPQYSLYQFNQLSINPAYAGARDAIACVVDMRKQWADVSGAPSTAIVSVHSPVMNNKLGVGLNLVSDKIGPKNATGIYLNCAYIAKINTKCKLSFGLRAGYESYKFNYSKVTYKDPNDQIYTDLANTRAGTLDVDAGVFMRANTWFAGISITHLNGGKIYNKTFSAATFTGTLNDYSLNYSLRPHLFVVLSKSFEINENLLINPSLMYKGVSGEHTSDINLNFLIKKRLWAGAFFRKGYGLGMLFQVYATDKFKIGYAYDTGMGGKRRLGASHEIMLGYDFGGSKTKMVSPRFL